MNPWTLFICAAVVVMGGIYPIYTKYRWTGRHQVPLAMIKGLGTLLAAGVAYAGFVRLPDTSSLLVTLGLAACAAADVVLNFHFAAGTGIFLAGHFLYLLTMLTLGTFQKTSILLFLILLVFVAVLFLPDLRTLGRQAFLYLFYGSVQLFMLSVALLLPGAIGTRGVAAAAGASLFAVSDILLAKGIVANGKGHPYLVMGLYYTAQLVLSLVSLQPWL